MNRQTEDHQAAENHPVPEKIPNPLPDPVPGRRTRLEFPIMDVDDKIPEMDSEGTDDFPDEKDGAEAREDDFDLSVSDDDDFDYD